MDLARESKFGGPRGKNRKSTPPPPQKKKQKNKNLTKSFPFPPPTHARNPHTESLCMRRRTPFGVLRGPGGTSFGAQDDNCLSGTPKGQFETQKDNFMFKHVLFIISVKQKSKI